MALDYFKAIFVDLQGHCEGEGVTKIELLKYANLPGVIGDRLFAIMDTNRNGKIDFRELVTTFYRIYCSSPDQHFKVAFDLFDFDRNGKLTRDEVQIVLSYVPLDSGFTPAESKAQSPTARLEVQQEINDILDNLFGNDETIDFETFKQRNEEVASDSMLLVMSTIKQCVPCTG